MCPYCMDTFNKESDLQKLVGIGRRFRLSNQKRSQIFGNQSLEKDTTAKLNY
uniref:Uncharacterized protein n=1 Tax=Rhizophora mucronata TaxID=61149 RepID=A0A2P2NH90_RHIMU